MTAPLPCPGVLSSPSAVPRTELLPPLLPAAPGGSQPSLGAAPELSVLPGELSPSQTLEVPGANPKGGTAAPASTPGAPGPAPAFLGALRHTHPRAGEHRQRARGAPHSLGEAAGSSTHRAEHPQHPQPRARLFPALGTALVGFHLSFFWVSDQQCPLLQLRGTNQQHQGFPAPRAAPLEVSGLALSLCVGQEPAELLAVQLPEMFQACHQPPLCHDHPPK